MNDAPTLFSRPSPVEPAPRLAAALGLRPADVVVKRDDVIGPGGGGNKVRKLEVTMGQALSRGATTVVTTGALQSNHARLTAAAASRLGLRAVLVLSGEPPAHPRGNLLLDELLRAEVVFSGERDPEDVADDVERRRAGDGVHRIPFGGSSPASAEAYATAGTELLEQVPDTAHVVVAVGSGGTMAGLTCALGPERVLGVDCGAVPDARATVLQLLRGMRPDRVWDADALRLDLTQVGRGYEHLSDGARQAMLLLGRLEGLVVDPTYTARAAAGLVHAARSGAFRPGERVVFWHTGGLPGLFGHPDLDQGLSV